MFKNSQENSESGGNHSIAFQSVSPNKNGNSKNQNPLDNA